MSKTVNPALVENKPQLAEVIQSLLDRFDGSYQFSTPASQATFAEGMHELGEHLALNSDKARLEISVSSEGIVTVSVSATPK